MRRSCTLAESLACGSPALPPLGPAADGYYLTGWPEQALGRLDTRGLIGFVRQRYRRSFASLDGDFDAYLGSFSAKARSTLRRKLKRFGERSGGAPDLRWYRRPEEMAEFHRHACAVSAVTYQERLLGAGMPGGPEALARLQALAADDQVRGWILFLDGAPIAYLYAPAEGDVLIYAHLGYDPAFADLSPGTVLQAEAMRTLFAEGRFRWFDFTEGEGQHKRLFGTGAVECVDLLLVRPTLANRLAGHALGGFDAAVALAKRAVTAARLEGVARAVRR